MFNSESAYIEYMKSLWVFRELAMDACQTPDGDFNTSIPQFRLLTLTNELIGALLNDEDHFSFINGAITHMKIAHNIK